MAGSPPTQRIASVRRRFAAFCASVGLEGAPDDSDIIEAFVVRGLAGRRPSTKGTYRSVLGGRRGPDDTIGPLTPFRGAAAPRPYTPAERAELLSMARAQRTQARRHSAVVMIAAGIGAGVSAAELVALRGVDITPARRGIVVSVGGRRPRAVPVRAPFAPPLAAAASVVGDGSLFRPGTAERTYKNFVNDFSRHLVAYPDGPHLSMGRCRASFIGDHLARGTPLSVILALTGIVEVESLLRYTQPVPGTARSKAELRRQLAAEDGR